MFPEDTAMEAEKHLPNRLTKRSWELANRPTTPTRGSPKHHVWSSTGKRSRSSDRCRTRTQTQLQTLKRRLMAASNDSESRLATNAS